MSGSLRQHGIHSWRSCDADSQPRFPEHFSSTSSLPIDTTTSVAMFTQTLRASVRAILSFRCIKANSCSAPRSPALRGSKLPAWSRDEPSSLLLPSVKVRGSFLFQQMVQLPLDRGGIWLWMALDEIATTNISRAWS